MTVLLTWIQEDGNYDKWKGGEGDSQAVLASDVAQRIREANTKVDRTAAAIVEKIKSLEKQFRQANDFRLQTGQGLLDTAAAAEGDDKEKEENMKLTEKSVEDAVLNYCPHYYDLVDVMGDRISTNPKGSYSTTGKIDAAGAALRRSMIGSDAEDDSDEDAGEEDEGAEEGDTEKMRTEKEEEPASKKLKVKKEASGRPSDTGRKFGKVNASSTPKRKSSGIEAALEQRNIEKTKQDAQLTEAKVKAEKMGTLMALARELREADYQLSFSEAMEEAKKIYAEI
ncbi:hypothetical protein CF326_g8583 [Tilletia indica]|nr:hypothetical protein CF326_g8583 [Tilletia indica]